MKVVLDVQGERFEVEVQRTPQGVRVECESQTLEATGVVAPPSVDLEAGGRRWRVRLDSDERATVDGQAVDYFVADFAPGAPLGALGAQARIPVRAAMHGRLVKVLVEPGKAVTKGEPLFVLEAMKMQNELAAPADGTVAEVVTKAGDVVEIGRVLAWLERRQ